MGVSEEEKREAKRQRNRKLRESVPSDIGARSGDLQVIGQLVDTSKRSMGVDRSSGKRLFVHRPMTVGYCVKNVSEKDVAMKRRLYKVGEPDEDGAVTYTYKDTDYVLKAGESVNLSKFDAARLFGRTEFGFTARNGYFTGAKGLENYESKMEEYYASRYFVPTTPLSDRDTTIINSEVGLRDVSDAFLPIFAFLLKTKKPKRRKVSSRCQLESLALAKYLDEHNEPADAESMGEAFEPTTEEMIEVSEELGGTMRDGGLSEEDYLEGDADEELIESDENDISDMVNGFESDDDDDEE